MKKRVLAIITSICMIIAMTPMGMAFAEDNENPRGQIGDKVYWELDDDGILHVTGEGDIDNFTRVGTTDSYGRDFEPYINDIEEIYMQSGIGNVGDNAFRGITFLRSVTISDTASSIGKNAFYGDNLLEEITIPDSVAEIKEKAFGYCSNATKLSIGKSLNSITPDVFYECRKIETIGVDEENETFSVLDNILYNKDKTRVVLCPMAYSKKVTLPDSVEVIGERAFEGCNYIPEIELNEGLKRMEYECLGFCYGLKSITLPQSLEKIDSRAFYFDYVNNITIPANVNSIGFMAFAGINDLTLTFEGSVPEFVPNDEGEYRIVALNSVVDIMYGCTVEGWTEEAFEKFENNTIRLHAHHDFTEESVAPTCTETGIEPSYVCSDCGNRYADEEGLQLIEDYEAWKQDEANIIPANGHDYGSWQMAKCPTCVKEGKICRICEVCTDVEYRNASVLPHEISKVLSLQPTFAAAGNIEYYKCSECGKCFSDEEGNNEIEKSETVIPKLVYSFKLSTSTYTYSGKAKKPSVTVKDENGNVIDSENYTLTYKNNIKAGKASVKVDFINGYEGSKSLTFKINPKKAVVSSLTPGTKKLTVKAKTKVSSTGGTVYQIGYRASGSSTWKYTTTTSSSKTIKSLKKDKRYKVKIRAYKTVDGKKYYGSWSAVKTSKKVK